MTGIPNIYYSALSGLNTAGTQLNTAAVNIASAANADPQDPQAPTTDLPTEVVHLSLAHHLYTANAIVLRTASDLTGTLLDILH